MLRDLRSCVNGNSVRRSPLATDARVHESDPQGWRTHHARYTHIDAAAAGADDLREAIRAQALELYLERLRCGWSGSVEDDWLTAEWNVLQRRSPRGRPLARPTH